MNRLLRHFFLVGVCLLSNAVGAEEGSEKEVEDTIEDKTVEDNPKEKKKSALPIIETSAASMRIGFTIQAGFDFLPNQVEGKRNSFTLQRARLRLDGHVLSKNLSYLLEGDAMCGIDSGIRKGAPGSEVLPRDGDQEVPFLLDAVLTWTLPKIGLSFSIGRFIPKWGLTMTEKVSELGAVNYPIYVQGAPHSLGSFRNIGIDVELELRDYLRVGGSVLNGGVNTWLDDNDRKDMLVYFTITPIPGLEIRPAGLFAFPNVEDGVRRDESPIEKGQETHIMPTLEARYRDYGLDLMIGGALDVAFRHEDDEREDYMAIGFMGHVGYLLIGDWFQLMARAEWWEPDDNVQDDEQLRITVGPQVRLESIHAQLNINYVQDMFESEQAMCVTYLDQPACDDLDGVPEAKKDASTILIQFVLDI